VLCAEPAGQQGPKLIKPALHRVNRPVNPAVVAARADLHGQCRESVAHLVQFSSQSEVFFEG
jgi:hypothetical protein